MTKFSHMKQEFVDMIPDHLREKLCLLGLQGSRALGMQQSEDADYDYRGVFIAPLQEMLSIGKTKETYEFGDGSDDQAEFVVHEVGKFMYLCMKGNPSAMQLLFLPTHNVKNSVGASLVANRLNLIGTRAIRNAFGGYALNQVKRLNKTNGFSKGQKRDKHIRHLLRLMDQGMELLTTGNLTYPIKNAQKYIELGNSLTNEEALEVFQEKDEKLSRCKSVLPDEPNKYLVDKLLYQIRMEMID